MSPKNRIETDSVLLREKIVKDVQAELFNEEKFYREKKVNALRVRDDPSSLSKRLDGKCSKTTKELVMDNDTSSLSTPYYFGREIKSMMDDDTTAPLSVMSTSQLDDSVDESIVSETTPRASNCVMPVCRNVEDHDSDQQGLVSCVGKEVADTSNDIVKLVDRIISLDESLLLKANDFFGRDQVQSLRSTFQEVSTEFDVLTCNGNALQNMCQEVSTEFDAATGCRASVKDLTCNRNALADKIIEEENMRIINLEYVPPPSQLEEQQPPKAPPKGGILHKLFSRRTKVRFAADTM